MKRDWNLIRQIMLAIENDTFSDFLQTFGAQAPAALNDHDFACWVLNRKAEYGPAVRAHLLMLKEGGLIEGEIDPFEKLDPAKIRITMSGYDVLEIFKLDDVWNEIASAARAGDCPLTTAAILEVSKCLTISKVKVLLKLA